jgi:hypothetical protein
MNCGNFDYSIKVLSIAITVTFILAVIIYLIYKYRRGTTIENYGGPIKNIRKIPMTDCYKICDYQYSGCRRIWPYDTIGKCEARQNACRSECYYSIAQRM